MPTRNAELHLVCIDKLVHGGQGLGRLPDGKVALVEGALPGEEVSIRVLKERGGAMWRP